jgi:uncharacterized membrane-anchored protein YitT (DUF2179 family)
MVFGWVTLLTYLLPGIPGFAWMQNLRYPLVELAVIVAAFAMILGFFNVFSVHANHIIRQINLYSLMLLLSIVGVVLVSFAEVLLNPGSNLAQQGVSGVWMTRVYTYVLIPIQASLAALLPFVLAFAAYRMLRVQRTGGAAIFLITAILVLLGQVPLLNLTALSTVREWIIRVPAMAGMRGILLGVAIGITATALRVLIGADRPTSD